MTIFTTNRDNFILKSFLNTFSNKPYYLFLATALVIAVICTVRSDMDSLDIHLHDTYFVVAYTHIAMAAAFGLTIFWLIYYWLYNAMYSKIVAWLHILVTCIAFILFFVPVQNEPVTGAPRRYYDYTAWESFRSYEGLDGFISVIVILAFFAQLLFLLNILLGLIRIISRRT